MSLEIIAIVALIIIAFGGGWWGFRNPGYAWGSGLVSLVALIFLVLILFDKIPLRG
jgi:hypothetical protein